MEKVKQFKKILKKLDLMAMLFLKMMNFFVNISKIIMID